MEKPKIRFVNPSEVHRIDDGLLNIDEEHTGEEIQNSRGFYKRMSMEEYRKHFSSMTDQQIKEVQIINNKDGNDKPSPRSETFHLAIDPFNDLVHTGRCYITHKIVDGEPVAEYNGRPMDVPFKGLLEDMLKYYPTPPKEKTDEDFLIQLRAIAMFKPEVFKEFLKNDYERIINKDIQFSPITKESYDGTRTK